MKVNKVSLFKSAGFTGLIVTPTGLYIDSLVKGQSYRDTMQSKLTAKEQELEDMSSALQSKDQELINQTVMYKHDLRNKNRTIRSLSENQGESCEDLKIERDQADATRQQLLKEKADLENRVEELTMERDQADATRQQLLDEKMELEDQLDEIQDQLDNLQEQIDSKNKAIKVLLTANTDKDKLSALLKEELINRKEADDILFEYMHGEIKRLNQVVKHVDELYDVITEMADNISNLNLAKTELEDTIKANAEDGDHSMVLNNELTELREQMTSMLETIAVAKSKIKSLENLNNDLKETVRKSMADETLAKKALDDYKDKLAELEAKIKWYENKSDKDGAEINKFKDELAAKEESIKQQQTLILAFNSSYSTLEGKVKGLQNQVKGLLNFSHTANTYTPYNKDLCSPDESDPTTYKCKGLFFNNPQTDGSNTWTNNIKKIINEPLSS